MSTDRLNFLAHGGDSAGADRYALACAELRGSWAERLTDAELSEAIESTGHLAARLYSQGASTEDAEGKLDELMAEFDRRNL